METTGLEAGTAILGSEQQDRALHNNLNGVQKMEVPLEENPVSIDYYKFWIQYVRKYIKKHF